MRQLVYIPEKISPPIGNDLSSFGSAVLTTQIYAWIANAETELPKFTSHSTFGHPRSQLTTSEGWRNLYAFGVKEGIVAIPFEAAQGHLSRTYQFLKYHLWTGSCAYTTCPAAMADGAAALLSRHLDHTNSGDERDLVFRAAYRNLTSRDPALAWSSGQWMTERPGGSDVRGTETVATLVSNEQRGGSDAHGNPLGPWRIDGFKWFSSATDSHMTLLLARTEKGISTFFAPMRRAVVADTTAGAGVTESELNGLAIQRLKNKLGTRPVPTAEIVLAGMRAWPIGEDGRGTREIATMLNITRLHTAMSAVGLWGRGLGISRAFARVRRLASGGALLAEVPAHVRILADNTVNYAAMMHLGFFAVAVTGITEHPKSFASAPMEARGVPLNTAVEAVALARLLAPVAKAMCSKYAITGLQECMESIGGVGYLEDEQEFNVARLYREANVCSIWEGTTDVLAHDVVRVIKGRGGPEARRVFKDWVNERLDTWTPAWNEAKELVRADVGRLEEMYELTNEELLYQGRSVLESLAWIVASVMLVEDAGRSGYRDEATMEMAKRWISRKASGLHKDTAAWKDSARLDRLIVFAEASADVAAKL